MNLDMDKINAQIADRHDVFTGRLTELLSLNRLDISGQTVIDILQMMNCFNKVKWSARA